MKLSRLYCNFPKVFPAIHFRDGLNVIFAKVQDPTLHDRDSHNLGKTFLIQVLDFALLGGLEKEHAFRKHHERFRDFVFYLELETRVNKFVTVRRPVHGRKAISIHIDIVSNEDLGQLPESDWSDGNLGLDAAKDVLNRYLGLTAISPFDFRKGLGYVLRRQGDYDDEFMISRFGRGKDKDWKPYMSLVLGFAQDLVAAKYELDDSIEERKNEYQRLEQDAGARSAEFDSLKGLLHVRSDAIRRLKSQLEEFSFKEIESRISQETIQEVEREIAELNEKRYLQDYEIMEIQRSLESSISLDTRRLRRVFEEAGIALAEGVLRNYDELVQFNRRIAEGRASRLRSLLSDLQKKRLEVDQRLEWLDNRRVMVLRNLREIQSMRKYQALQEQLFSYKDEVSDLRVKLSGLDRATAVKREISQLEHSREATVSEITQMIRSGSPTYSAIRSRFATYVEAILSVPAVLSVVINSVGNLEFRTRTVSSSASRKETSEDRGSSYKKVLCACFDLAVLAARSRDAFYHFVYHDGVFEGLDNRKKVAMLDLVRGVCNDTGLQYILTVIDSDLPRNDSDQKLLFDRTDIVRELHDGGDKGRLFRMPSF